MMTATQTCSTSPVASPRQLQSHQVVASPTQPPNVIGARKSHSNSTLLSKEAEFQNWKLRKNNDPMKAVAEGKKNKEERGKAHKKKEKMVDIPPKPDIYYKPTPSTSITPTVAKLCRLANIERCLKSSLVLYNEKSTKEAHVQSDRCRCKNCIARSKLHNKKVNFMLNTQYICNEANRFQPKYIEFMEADVNENQQEQSAEEKQKHSERKEKRKKETENKKRERRSTEEKKKQSKMKNKSEKEKKRRETENENKNRNSSGEKRKRNEKKEKSGKEKK